MLDLGPHGKDLHSQNTTFSQGNQQHWDGEHHAKLQNHSKLFDLFTGLNVFVVSMLLALLKKKKKNCCKTEKYCAILSVVSNPSLNRYKMHSRPAD